jgi:hypothetical protein
MVQNIPQVFRNQAFQINHLRDGFNHNRQVYFLGVSITWSTRPYSTACSALI